MSSVTITSMIMLLENRESLFIKQRNAILENLELNYSNYIHALLKQKLFIANKIRHQYDEFIKNNRNLIDELQTNLLLHLITELVHSQVVPDNLSISTTNNSEQNQEQALHPTIPPTVQCNESIHDDEQQQCIDSPINIQSLQSNNVENDDSVSAFPEHITIEKADKLDINDVIDHRDIMGWFTPATVVDKNGTKLKIHYSGWSAQYDTWSDYKEEVYRFALYKSISRRPRHRLFNIKKGDLIDINPIYCKEKGWKIGEIEEIDINSGQVKVAYTVDDNEDFFYNYWCHIDNTNEIAALHTFTVESVSAYDCIFCDKSFENHSRLREHIINNHSKRKCLCRYCPQGFIHHTAVEIHEKQHTEHHDFKCILCKRLYDCDTSFKLKQTLTRHLRRVHKIDTVNASTETFVSGQKRKNISSNIDSIPSKKTKIVHEAEDMDNNIENENENEDKDDDGNYNEFKYYISINCHICRNHFDEIKTYSDHLKNHYELDEYKTWRHCDLGCNVTPNHPRKTASYTGVYASSSQFISHIATHTKEYPFRCGALDAYGVRCNHATAQLFGLQQHWKNNHYRKGDQSDDDDNGSMELLTYERAQSMIVSDLRDEMKKRGLDARGQKKTLLNRLKDMKTNEKNMNSESVFIIPSLENMPIIETIDNHDTVTLAINTESTTGNFVSTLPSLQ